MDQKTVVVLAVSNLGPSGSDGTTDVDSISKFSHVMKMQFEHEIRVALFQMWKIQQLARSTDRH
jgi:hypothetical protein